MPGEIGRRGAGRPATRAEPERGRLGERGAERADDRHLETVEDPRDAERATTRQCHLDQGSRSRRCGTSVSRRPRGCTRLLPASRRAGAPPSAGRRNAMPGGTLRRPGSEDHGLPGRRDARRIVRHRRGAARGDAVDFATFVFTTTTDSGGPADGPGVQRRRHRPIDDGFGAYAVAMVMVDADRHAHDVDGSSWTCTGFGGSDGDYGSRHGLTSRSIGPVTYASST